MALTFIVIFAMYFDNDLTEALPRFLNKYDRTKVSLRITDSSSVVYVIGAIGMKS